MSYVILFGQFMLENMYRHSANDHVWEVITTLLMPGLGRLLAGGKCLGSSLHSEGGIAQSRLSVGMVTLGMLNPWPLQIDCFLIRLSKRRMPG